MPCVTRTYEWNEGRGLRMDAGAAVPCRHPLPCPRRLAARGRLSPLAALPRDSFGLPRESRGFVFTAVLGSRRDRVPARPRHAASRGVAVLRGRGPSSSGTCRSPRGDETGEAECEPGPRNVPSRSWAPARSSQVSE